jgi:hypothetical protein
MKKPSKTAAELEASIKVEMEDICDWPTDMMISFSLTATVGKWRLSRRISRGRRSSGNGRTIAARLKLNMILADVMPSCRQRPASNGTI